MVTQAPRRADPYQNDDIRISDEVVKRYPTVAILLQAKDVEEAFGTRDDPKTPEGRANALKKQILWAGTLAVLFMLISLVTAALRLQIGDRLPLYAAWVGEIVGLPGLILAWFASPIGPWRQQWLANRFVTECLRQWKYRQFLYGAKAAQAADPAQEAAYLTNRKKEFDIFLDDLLRQGQAANAMRMLLDQDNDPMGAMPNPQLPTGKVKLREDLLNAYYKIRLLGQLGYANSKLGVDDPGKNKHLTAITRNIAGTALTLSVVLTLIGFFVNWGWSAFLGITLTMIGVAVKAWREGLQIESDRTRFKKMWHDLQVLEVEWRTCGDDDTRYRLAAEVEKITLNELKDFLRHHRDAGYA